MTASEVLWVEDAGRGSCAVAADWEPDLPSPGDLAAEYATPTTPAGHAAVLASLPQQEAREHARNLAAWHTPGSSPDPLHHVLAPYLEETP